MRTVTFDEVVRALVKEITNRRGGKHHLNTVAGISRSQLNDYLRGPPAEDEPLRTFSVEHLSKWGEAHYKTASELLAKLLTVAAAEEAKPVGTRDTWPASEDVEILSGSRLTRAPLPAVKKRVPKAPALPPGAGDEKKKDHR